MKAKQIIKLAVDIAMVILLPLLMLYSMIGDSAHEWMGIGMTVLFILHHILNCKFYISLAKGKHSPVRILGTTVDILLTVCILMLASSGIMMSRHAVPFLSSVGGIAVCRTLHMVGAYWGMIFMSFHAGMHGSMIFGTIRKVTKVQKPSVVRAIILRLITAVIAGYGIYALIYRQIIDYLFLKNQFVFFDFSESLIRYITDYSAIILLFIFVGYYAAKVFKTLDRRRGNSI